MVGTELGKGRPRDGVGGGWRGDALRIAAGRLSQARGPGGR